MSSITALPLRPSQSFLMPATVYVPRPRRGSRPQSAFAASLRGGGAVLADWHGKAVRAPRGSRERREGRVALEALSECGYSVRTKADVEQTFMGGGGTETRANQSGVRALSSRLERGQRRIALETLSECGPTLGTEGVLEQTADGLTLTGEGGASKSACRFEKEGYLTALTVRFFDKSNARSFASAASRPRLRKSMSVCSGWMPQSVMICDISEAEDTIASALSPSEFLSRLNRGRCVNRS